MTIIPFPSDRRRRQPPHAPHLQAPEHSVPEDPSEVPLVRVPTASVLSEALRAQLAAVASVAEHALAPATTRAYRSHWRQFTQWCEAHDRDPFPASSETVACYLIERVAVIDDQGQIQREPTGEPVRGQWRPVTAEQALAAIDRVHRAQGVREPGDDPEVTTLLQGMRRLFGMAPLDAKDPLLWEDVVTICDHIDGRDGAMRAAFALALKDHGLSLRELSLLSWSDLSDRPDGATVATVKRRSTVRTVELDDHTAVLAERLRGTRSTGPVFGMTKQGIARLLRRALTTVDLTAPAPTPSATRDRALALLGFFCAQRRENLAALRWNDLKFEREGLSIHIRRSKTDQEGHGETVWIDGRNGGPYCPLAALREWAAHVAAAVGAHPIDDGRADFPVFLRVERNGEVRIVAGQPIGLTPAGLADILKRRAQAAGIDPARIGMHSLRAGFVTAAFDAGAGIPAVQDVTLHKSVSVLMGYYRQANKRRNNPAARILADAARKDS